MTGSVKINNQLIFIIVFVLIILAGVYLYYPYKEEDAALVRANNEPGELESMEALLTGKEWPEIQEKLQGDRALSLEESFIKIGEHNVYYRKASSSSVSVPRGSLLFLHGAAFSSNTWKELGTLYFMAAAGYTPIAIDLPGGKGKTEQFSVDQLTFFSGVKEAFGLKDTPVIIISPSMSGAYTIPLLFAKPEAFKGYVPVAPIGTGSRKPDEYKKVKVPTCIIYGEKDKGLGLQSLADLRNIPGSEVHVLKDAGHAAYMNAPKEFHQILLDFTNKLFSRS